MSLADLFKKKETPGKPAKVDDASFEQEVLAAPGPVLVDFWASWCAPCQVLGGLLAEVGPDYAGRIRILKLNVEESPQTAARYGVQSIPTMIAFKNGKLVEKKVGLLPLQPLKQWLDRLAR
jgi:thioredoxin 1